MRVDVEHFRMCIGERTIIDDLSFVVEAGETFGFLGSNGSGKTTTLRALLGMCRATGGRLLIDGEPLEPGSGAPVGYLPEERGLYRKDAVLDIMIYFAQIKGIGRWSAEIYLLFAEGRRDIWPAGDLAVQAGLHKIMSLPARPSEKEARALAEPWRPHRGAIAILTWHCYNNAAL